MKVSNKISSKYLSTIKMIGFRDIKIVFSSDKKRRIPRKRKKFIKNGLKSFYISIS